MNKQNSAFNELYQRYITKTVTFKQFLMTNLLLKE
jgi:hypothetical protein